MPVVTCPSGLKFEARTWNNGDTLTNLDMGLNEEGLVAITMVKRASGRVLDPGPYPFEEGGKVDFNKVSNADITWAAVAIRAETKAIHPFDSPCEACGKVNDLQQDIREVKMLPSSEEGINHLKTGEAITVDICGIPVELKLLRGCDIPEMAKLQAKDQKAIVELQVCMSITSIKDPKRPKPITELNAIRRYWKMASWEFTEALEEAIDEHEGGPDIYVEFKCTKTLGCHRENVTVLPLDMAFFGLDHMRGYRRSKRREKKPRSSSEQTSQAEKDSPEQPPTS